MLLGGVCPLILVCCFSCMAGGRWEAVYYKPLSGLVLPRLGPRWPEGDTDPGVLHPDRGFQQLELLATEAATKRRRQMCGSQMLHRLPNLSWSGEPRPAPKSLSSGRGFLSPHIKCSASSQGRAVARMTCSCGVRARPTAGGTPPAKCTDRLGSISVDAPSSA